MSIVRDEQHSNGVPTIEGTGIRVKDIAIAYEHSGYDSDEITQLYPGLMLSDVRRALVYYYNHIGESGLSIMHLHEATLLRREYLDSRS